MANEEAIKQELTGKFPFLADKIVIKRERRIFADVPQNHFREVFEHTAKKMDFVHLCIITGLDDGDNLLFIYHLAKMDGTVLNLKTTVPKSNPVIKTITDIFPGGVIYERELIDLLGTKVEGIPPGKRYPLPDNWPANQYPLRKDWKPEMLEGKDGRKEEAKNG
jgi:membrane-bound hydrogenase subunit beta